MLELLVAISLAAILLALAPAALDRARDGLSYRSTVRELMANLREARTLAVRAGRPIDFFVNLKTRAFGIDGRVQGNFPEILEVGVVTAATASAAQGEHRIVFLPDGSSTGGSVQVTRKSGQGVRLRVDWLLGRITQEAPNPS